MTLGALLFGVITVANVMTDYTLVLFTLIDIVQLFYRLCGRYSDYRATWDGNSILARKALFLVWVMTARCPVETTSTPDGSTAGNNR